MANTIEKRMFTTMSELTTFLQSIGFTIANNKMILTAAESDSNCYWQIINNEQIIFKRSDGQSAFTDYLIDFSSAAVATRPKCAVVALPLLDGGIALYLGMVTAETSISDVFLNCKNADSILHNGLVVCSAAEDDGHWYYGWNSPNNEVSPDDYFYWCLDNGHGSYEYYTDVTQVPLKRIIPSALSLTLVKTFLNTGYWSKEFRVQVTGELLPPGSVFQINGQKYITFTNNNIYRAPAYKLPPEALEQNESTSTDPYSSLKLYVKGDYCTYEGYLYRCLQDITSPEVFDPMKWQRTTVHTEMLEFQYNIYGDLT